MKKWRLSFTLICLLLTAAPQCLEASPREEAQSKRLSLLRSEIARFKKLTGDFPFGLLYLYSGFDSSDPLCNPPVGPNGVEYKTDKWKPRLTGVMPIDPFTERTDWVYNSVTGEVVSAYRAQLIVQPQPPRPAEEQSHSMCLFYGISGSIAALAMGIFLGYCFYRVFPRQKREIKSLPHAW